MDSINPELSLKTVRYFFGQHIKDTYRLGASDGVEIKLPFSDYKGITFIQLIDDALQSELCQTNQELYDELDAIKFDYDNDSTYRYNVNSVLFFNVYSNIIMTESEKISESILRLLITYLNELSTMSLCNSFDINGERVVSLFQKYSNKIATETINLGFNCVQYEVNISDVINTLVNMIANIVTLKNNLYCITTDFKSSVFRDTLNSLEDDLQLLINRINDWKNADN